MPIDWGSREMVFRLLAAAFAVIGKERFKGTYGEIARLFGEPATYDAIQCQFREVSKMAEGLRDGKACTHIRQRSVTTPKPGRRLTRPPSNRDHGDFEVIAKGRDGSVPYRAARPETLGRPSGDAGYRAVQSSKWVRPSQPPPPLASSSQACSVAHQEEFIANRPAPPAVNGMIESVKPIPEATITPVQADRVTASFETEIAAHAASLAHPNEAKEHIPRTPSGHAEERAQFRKLYSSDSHGTPAERVDKLLSLNSQEHAAERARYRSLYFPNRVKDTAPAGQDILEAHSTASAPGPQGPEDDVIMATATEEHKLSSIARSFGENATKDIYSPVHNDVSSLAQGIANRAYSYMDHENRKCLLCDGRRFPGEAFYQHERKSQRHRENLRSDQKVAEGNARLERKMRRETWRRKNTQILGNVSLPLNFGNSVFSKMTHPPSQDGQQQLRERSTALSPDHIGPSISLPTQKQESVASEPNPPTGTHGKQFMQHANDGKFVSPALDERPVIRQEEKEHAAPLKRKRAMLEPEESEASVQTKAKQAKRVDGKGNGGHDVLVQLSPADLDKLLRLHPDIFDTNWNERSTPAPLGWQAIGPSTSKRTRKTAFRRVGHGSEVLDMKLNPVGHRDSSATSRDYFQCASRYDDSADSDYQQEEDEDEAEEYDDEMIEEED